MSDWFKSIKKDLTTAATDLLILDQLEQLSVALSLKRNCSLTPYPLLFFFSPRIPVSSVSQLNSETLLPSKSSIVCCDKLLGPYADIFCSDIIGSLSASSRFWQLGPNGVLHACPPALPAQLPGICDMLHTHCSCLDGEKKVISDWGGWGICREENSF